ncbi:MAG: 4Fe-4S binding protein [Prevotellaceae bacterium]|nr:4Fe-4S binding protein [Prevotellaceae bacterium]MDD7107416.1 4Fe-4S binding protein [Prevotellaceae bacterium]MDY3295364.1 4Fe-4S binding protein [Bacteroidaceae bacterium]
MKNSTYLGGILDATKSLIIGLKTSIKVFFEHHETEQYPENRATLTFTDRNRFCLEMPHNENNEHKCIACGLCQMACPNDSITVTSQMVTLEDGKKKKQLVKYEYNLGQCMFCNLCVTACPQDAIRFNQEFENAVFDKSKLILTLNQPGSHCMEKPKPAAPKAEPAPSKKED